MKAALLVLAAAVVPYLGILDAPFVFDDLKLVRDNPRIRDLSGILSTFDIFSKEWDAEEVRANYRPLRFLTYAIDYRITRALWGDFPPERLPTAVFHAHNVLLHALNAVLVLSIGRLLLGSGAAALVLGLLFALHPAATEAVTYVSGRRDVLSTFFFLAALLLHLRGEGWLRAAGVALLFVLALLSKEMAVTLPAVILLVDLARPASPGRARFGARRVVLTAGLFAISISFTWLQASNPGLVAGAAGGSPVSALLTAPRFVARYLGLLLFPHPQSIDYSFDAIPSSRGLLEPWTTLPAILIVVLLLGAGLVALRFRRLAAAVGLLWFLLTLTPVLQIVPIPERFAERFVYLPSIGFFLLAAAGFHACYRRRGEAGLAAGWIAAVALFSLGLGAALRNRDWASSLDLWGSAARAQPRAARAHLGHGHALLEAGKPRDAVQAYTRALEIWGDAPPPSVAGGEPGRARGDELLRWGQVLHTRTSRAQSHAGLGQENPEHYRRAVADYRWLLVERDIDGVPIGDSPRHLVLRFQLANCLLGLSASSLETAGASELRDEAREQFLRVAAAEEAQPSLARASRYQLSKIALAGGDAAGALAEMEEAHGIARRRGDRMDRYRLSGELADLLIARKDLDRADALLEASIAELGDLPERKHLLYRRSRIADRKGEIAMTARFLEDALRIDPGFAPALLTLAALEESRGQLDRAEELYRRLLQAAPDEPRALRGLKGLELRRDLSKQKGKDGDAAPAEGVSTRSLLEGLLSRGEGHLKKGELLAAVEPFRRAALSPPASGDSAALRPLRALALRRLAAIALELKKLPEAEGYLSLAIAADPTGREALLELADLQVRDKKDRQAAARTYEEYLETYPAGELAPTRVYLNLGSLLKEEDPRRAVECYLTAKRAGFQDPALERNLGYLLARLGRWDEAWDSFQEYLDRPERSGEPPEEASEREKVRRFLQDQVAPMVKEGEALRDAGSAGGREGNPEGSRSGR